MKRILAYFIDSITIIQHHTQESIQIYILDLFNNDHMRLVNITGHFELNDRDWIWKWLILIC